MAYPKRLIRVIGHRKEPPPKQVHSVVTTPACYSLVLVNKNCRGRQWGKEEAKGMSRVIPCSDWYLFYGTRCQRQIPVPNISATRTFGTGTITVM